MALPGSISARVVAVIRKTAAEEIRVSVLTFGPGDEMAGKEVALADDEGSEDAVVEEELPEENEAEDLNSALLNSFPPVQRPAASLQGPEPRAPDPATIDRPV